MYKKSYERLAFSCIKSGNERFLKCLKCGSNLENRSLARLEHHNKKCKNKYSNESARNMEFSKSLLQNSICHDLPEAPLSVLYSVDNEEPGNELAAYNADIIKTSSVSTPSFEYSVNIAAPGCEDHDSRSSVYFSSYHCYNVNDLVNRLRLLMLSQSAVKYNHKSEIQVILQELKSARIIA